MLIPYGTERRLQTTPVLTYTLIGLNVVAFLLVWLLVPPETATGVAAPTGQPREETPKEEIEEELGAGAPAEATAPAAAETKVATPWVVAGHRWGFVPASPQWYSVVTAMFLHGTPFHLIWNMLFLWIFGSHLEDALGRKSYAVLYFSSGVAALLIHYVMTLIFARAEAAIPAVGASGAVAGLLGLFAIRFYRTRILFTFLLVSTFTIPAIWGLLAWLGQEVYAGLQSLISTEHTGVANWAHVGGFMYGMLMALVLKLETEAGEDYFVQDAEEALRLGKWDQVIERYAVIVSKDESNQVAHAALAKAYAMSGADELSRGHYRRAIELLIGASQPRQALVVYKELRMNYPDYAPPANMRYQIGCICETGGDYRQAYEEFEAVLAMEPAPPEAQVSLLKKAQITLRHFQRPREAVELFREFLQKYGDSAWAIAAEDGINEAEAIMSGRKLAGGTSRTPGGRFPGR